MNNKIVFLFLNILFFGAVSVSAGNVLINEYGIQSNYMSEDGDTGLTENLTYRDWNGAAQYLIIKNGLIINSTGEAYTPENSSWLDSWGYKVPCYINTTVSSDLSDFPVSCSIDTYEIISEGKMKSDGSDIVIADENGNLLDFEIENINDQSIDTIIWVKLPVAINQTAENLIYIYYNNSEASDSQNASGVWSNGYRAVWHFNNNFEDSVNGKDLSTSGTWSFQTGKYGYEAYKTSTQYAYVGLDNSYFNYSDEFSISGYIAARLVESSSNYNRILLQSGENNNAPAVRYQGGHDGSWSVQIHGGSVLPLRFDNFAYHWFGINYDGSSNFYAQNSSLIGSSSISSEATPVIYSLIVGTGTYLSNFYQYHTDSNWDELRWRQINSSRDWLTAEFEHTSYLGNETINS